VNQPAKQLKAHTAKRLARLAAVQALYQIALTGRDAADVIRDSRDHPRSLFLDERISSSDVDQESFGDIVNGVTQNAAALDELIAGAIDAKLSAGRLEILLRAILRAGVYELHHHGAISTGVIINDYVDVTHSFFNGKEPGLVNAMLDKLAKKLRPN
jgi:N utilization substance protein B